MDVVSPALVYATFCGAPSSGRTKCEVQPPAAVTGPPEIAPLEIKQRCGVLIAEEQHKVSPDQALIGLLCDVVRWLDYCDEQKGLEG